VSSLIHKGFVQGFLLGKLSKALKIFLEAVAKAIISKEKFNKKWLTTGSWI
jgi:hypothetical protein